MFRPFLVGEEWGVRMQPTERVSSLFAGDQFVFTAQVVRVT